MTRARDASSRTELSLIVSGENALPSLKAHGHDEDGVERPTQRGRSYREIPSPLQGLEAFFTVILYGILEIRTGSTVPW
jgi:hypothetical protein